MALTKKISRIGNSYGVILPIDLLKIAGLEPDGDCEINVDQHGIHLRPAMQKADDQDVIEAMARFVKRYRKDLKKLAS